MTFEMKAFDLDVGGGYGVNVKDFLQFGTDFDDEFNFVKLFFFYSKQQTQSFSFWQVYDILVVNQNYAGDGVTLRRGDLVEVLEMGQKSNGNATKTTTGTTATNDEANK